MFTLYRVLVALAIPLILVPYEILRGRGRYLAQRLGRTTLRAPAAGRPRIVIHAVSVGEMGAAAALVPALSTELPNCSLVLTSGNRDGLAAAGRLARQHPNIESTILLPWDRAPALERWLAALQPSLFVVVETELWPGLFRVCARRGVPLCIVNGRIYPADLGRYRLLRGFFGRVLEQVVWIGAQSETERSRFEEIGAPPAGIDVVGNLKYDVPGTGRGTDVEGRLGKGGPLLVGASTHAPEEQCLLDAFTRLRERLQGLRLVIAPRNVARAGTILDLARERSLRAETWTQPSSNESDVWVIDEMGRLPDFFEHADVVFVGGSLAPHGGHNVLEPAAHGRAILVGPHVEHFRGVVDDFLEGRALIGLSSAEDLYPEMLRLLTDDTERRALGRRARELCEAGRGSAKVHARRLADIMSRTVP